MKEVKLTKKASRWLGSIGPTIDEFYFQSVYDDGAETKNRLIDS